MFVRDVMTTHVHAIDPDVSLTVAARKMRDDNVGSLLVTKDDSVLGVVTDRDLVVRILAEGASAHTASVRQAMSTSFVSCRDDQPVEEALRLIAEHGLRRLPVLDGKGRLVGIASLSDLSGGAVGPTRPRQVVFYKQLSGSGGQSRDVPLATIYVSPHIPPVEVAGIAISKFQEDFCVGTWSDFADRYEVLGAEDGMPASGAPLAAHA